MKGPGRGVIKTLSETADVFDDNQSPPTKLYWINVTYGKFNPARMFKQLQNLWDKWKKCAVMEEINTMVSEK